MQKKPTPRSSFSGKRANSDSDGLHTHSNKSISPGLYIVATPIGNLGDITLRAVETLKSVDMIACEDTRVSTKLLHHLGIQKKLISYHEHNAEKMRPKIVEELKQGRSIALISDAGTPLISDPGYKLVREVVAEKIPLTSLPGPSSVITALTLSAMPTDHFVFAGFVNSKDFEALQYIPYTLIFFSTAQKLLKDLALMAPVFKGREVAIVREITKMFEEVQRGSFPDVMNHYTVHPAKGEIVLLLSPPSHQEVDLKTLDQEIQTLRKKYSVKELSEILAQKYSLKKRDIYQRILDLE